MPLQERNGKSYVCHPLSLRAEAPALPGGDPEPSGHFRAHSYVILPDLLSPEWVATLNEAIDRDRKERPYFWGTASSNGTSNLLLTEPIFEEVVRHPAVCPWSKP